MIILCGKSGSGKDTVGKELVDMGYKRVVTYTTRPMRPGELDGHQYHFVSVDKFEELQESGFFLETTQYNVANGDTWRYGTPADGIDENSIIIMNPDGVKKILAHKELNPIVFYLFVDEPERTRRLIGRGDDPIEMHRRKMADDIDFDDIGLYCDVAVPNTAFTPDRVAEYIDFEYRKMLKRTVKR